MAMEKLMCSGRVPATTGRPAVPAK
jgi:hypothetical protein